MESIIFLNLYFAMLMFVILVIGIYELLKLRIPYTLRMIDETIDQINHHHFPTSGWFLTRGQYWAQLRQNKLKKIDIKIESIRLQGPDYLFARNLPQWMENEEGNQK
jgi:hypothetical protein